MPTPKTTSPAFQFYPKDFLSSTKVGLMSMTERGVYITLLSRNWLDGSLPDDISVLSRMVGMKPAQFERMWNGSLRECFDAKDGRLTNLRLEKERKAQIAYRRKQQEKANNRWSRGNAVALPDTRTRQSRGNGSHPHPHSQIASLLDSSETGTVSKPAETSPTVMEFPTDGADGAAYRLSEAQCAEWAQLFPNLDVRQDLRNALAWVLANPGRRKTVRGMPRFLVSWLTRSNDRGGARVLPHVPVDRGPDPAKAKYGGMKFGQ